MKSHVGLDRMQVQELDREDTGVVEQIHELMLEAFGAFDRATLSHIVAHSSPDTKVFGVFEGSQLTAVNCFTAHRVHRQGAASIGYQSCMSATRKHSVGRGLFTKIIEHAKINLADSGAAFIFGFPNSKSGPIFVEKLGFSIAEIRPVYFSRMLPAFLALNDQKLLEELSMAARAEFDWYEIADWKRTRHGELFEFEHLTNYLFGIVKQRSIGGLAVSMLIIGGIEINKPLIAGRFIAAALKKSGAKVARLNANVSSPITCASKIVTRGKTEPIICFPLNWEIAAGELEAFGGLKDVY